MAVTFPLILLLIDYLRNRPDRTRLLIEKVPFLVASLGFGILAIIAQRAGDALTDIERFPFYQNIAVSLYGVWMYLLKLVAPFQLSAFHPYPGAVSGTLDWYVYAAAIPVIALAFFAYRAAIRSRAIAFGLGFFFSIHSTRIAGLIRRKCHYFRALYLYRLYRSFLPSGA